MLILPQDNKSYIIHRTKNSLREEVNSSDTDKILESIMEQSPRITHTKQSTTVVSVIELSHYFKGRGNPRGEPQDPETRKRVDWRLNTSRD